ncbi:hypothetical protein, partial [Anaerotignum sp.]|uniref:hypothetical protein n=1 Tax=Anaerotignum sp. TaxID=2039241 RepID=UPI0027154364
KATYMYWQKRFDRVDPNQELEDKVIEIHGVHKDFGYRRMCSLINSLRPCLTICFSNFLTRGYLIVPSVMHSVF